MKGFYKQTKSNIIGDISNSKPSSSRKVAPKHGKAQGSDATQPASLISMTQATIHMVGRTTRGEGAKGKALLVLIPEELQFIRYLKAAKVPVKELQINEKKLLNARSRLEKCIAEDCNMNKLAKDAYRAYISAYNSHSLKDIFNVHRLDLQVTGSDAEADKVQQFSLLVLARKFVTAMIILDTWQYFMHRYMHHKKFLYKHIHSQHHSLIVSYAYGALYNHPVEGLLKTIHLLLLFRHNQDRGRPYGLQEQLGLPRYLSSALWNQIQFLSAFLCHMGSDYGNLHAIFT